jgi:hypothetical protein
MKTRRHALFLAGIAILACGGSMTTAKPNPSSPRSAETKAAARRFYDSLNQALESGDFSLLDASWPKTPSTTTRCRG